LENWTENQFKKQVRVQESPNSGKNRILFYTLLKRSWLKTIAFYNIFPSMPANVFPKLFHMCHQWFSQ
jgi:hypothetical protein